MVSRAHTVKVREGVELNTVPVFFKLVSKLFNYLNVKVNIVLLNFWTKLLSKIACANGPKDDRKSVTSLL